MGLLQQQHEAHKAARDRLWPAKPKTFARAQPPEPEPPPDPVVEVASAERETKLALLRARAAVIAANIAATVHPTQINRGVTGPPVGLIVRMVAAYYGISRHDIISARREASIVLPRHVAFYLAKKMTLLSLPMIGRQVGGRDHSTILHAIDRITTQRKVDRTLDADLDKLTEMLCIPAKIPAFLPVRA